MNIIQWSTSTIYGGNVPAGFGDPAALGEEKKIQLLTLKDTTIDVLKRTALTWLTSSKWFIWLYWINLLDLYTRLIYTEEVLEVLKPWPLQYILLIGLIPLYIIVAWIAFTPWPLSYHAIIAYVWYAAAEWWTYVTADRFDRTAWLRQREILIQYTCMAVALQNWRNPWSYPLWFVWHDLIISIAPVVLAIGVSVAPKLVRCQVIYIHAPFIYAMGTIVTTINDIKDYAEIIVAVWLPRAFQLLRMRNIPGPTYTYEPLRSAHIRQLTILPGSGTIETTLEQKYRYVAVYAAISYQWKSPEKIRQILVNGKRMAITETAFQALLACRSFFEPRTVWIDAICINQDDEDEKAEQVKLMPLIYRQAWLVRLFPTFSPWDRLVAFAIHDRRASPGFDDVNKSLDVVRMTRGSIDQRWQAVSRVARSEYWTRGWVAQEFALADHKVVYLGGCWVNLDDLSSLLIREAAKDDITAFKLATRGKLTAFDMCPMESQRALHLLYNHNGPNGKNNLSLEQILLLTWQFRTTDPRDQAYAMLGIAAGDKLFEPHREDNWRRYFQDVDLAYGELAASYKISPEYLFQKLAMMHFLRDTPTNHLLALAGTGYNKNRLNVPSWVPDLSEIRYARPYTCLIEAEKPWCEAATSIPPRMSAGPQGSLQIHGIFRGRITHINTKRPLLPTRSLFTPIELAERKRAWGQGALNLLEATPQTWHSDRLKEMNMMWVMIGGCGSVDQANPEVWEQASFVNAITLWVGIQARMAQGDDLRSLMMKDFKPEPEDITFLRRGRYVFIDRAIQEFSFGRQIAVTSEWRTAVVPPLTQVDDLVFIPAGAQTPYLVRKHSDVYELVGEANISGLQDGEATFEEMEEITLK